MNLKDFAFTTMQTQFENQNPLSWESINENIDDGADKFERDYEERYMRGDFDGFYY